MAGRPNKYDTYIKPRFNEIEKWLSLGITEKEISKNLGVNKSTFIEYKKKYPELKDLIKKNRTKSVEEIKSAMLKRATGFKFEERKTTETKIKFPEGIKDILIEAGIDVSKIEKPTLIKTETTIKTSLPDPTAGLILLKHWDKETVWTGDPETLKLKKKEYELKKKQAEKDNW